MLLSNEGFFDKLEPTEATSGRNSEGSFFSIVSFPHLILLSPRTTIPSTSKPDTVGCPHNSVFPDSCCFAGLPLKRLYPTCLVVRRGCVIRFWPTESVGDSAGELMGR